MLKSRKKNFLARFVGLTVANVVSAAQKLVLVSLSSQKRGAEIRYTPWKVNRSLYSQSKEVNMRSLKQLVASIARLLIALSVSTRRFARIPPPTT